MVKYEVIEDKNLWNDSLLSTKNYSPYQIFEWGEYKKSIGWRVISIEANKDGKKGYLQITYKIKFDIFFGWCVGGIANHIESFEKKDFIEFLQRKFSVKKVYIRSNFTNILNFNESLSLYTSGWLKTSVKLNSEYTINIDLSKSLDEIINNCSSNFRKNIKRGLSKNSSIIVDKLSKFDENEISEVFTTFKTIKSNVVYPDLSELRIIKEKLSNNIIVSASIFNDKIIGIRAFLFFGRKAIDFWSATDEIGRKQYTSYALLFKILGKAKELGIDSYDMGGIDPVNNPTVYNFKNGLRADIVEKLGEWELTNSKLLSFIMNRYISFKKV